jgi:hypothetical protein
MGIDVGDSLGVFGRTVLVGSGVRVKVEAGMGVKVSDVEMPVDVFTGEGELVGLPLLGLQAKVVMTKTTSKYELLIFITSLY